MKSYLNYFKLRVITNLQYRVASIAGISTQFSFGLVYIMVYLALYESNTDVSVSFDLKSLISYLWLQQAFLACTYPFIADNELMNMIKNGNIAYELVRPQNFYLKFYIKLLANRVVSTLLRFSPIIIIGLLLPSPLNLSLPNSLESFILFIISLIFACLLTTSLTLLVHIITFYTVDSRGITTIYGVLGELLMGFIIPLPLMPSILQKIASVLPFRFVNDVPFRIYSGNIDVNSGIYLIIGSIFWIIITILIGYIITNNALKKAVIQGG